MTERVRIEKAQHVKVTLDGQTIADSRAGYVVHETGLPDRYYVPRSDIRAELIDGAGTGTCPWKGLWRHLDVALGDKRVSNGAWTYYETEAVTDPMRDFVAFYESKFVVETGA
jgi:uncharacterized protein (DUF427 family)